MCMEKDAWILKSAVYLVWGCGHNVTVTVHVNSEVPWRRGEMGKGFDKLCLSFEFHTYSLVWSPSCEIKHRAAVSQPARLGFSHGQLRCYWSWMLWPVAWNRQVLWPLSLSCVLCQKRQREAGPGLQWCQSSLSSLFFICLYSTSLLFIQSIIVSLCIPWILDASILPSETVRRRDWFTSQHMT